MKHALIRSSELGKKAVDAALEKQATDILMLDVRETAGFADYLIICSAESKPQISAVTDEIDKVLGKDGVNVYRREGSADSGWVLLDYSAVVVHVFAPEQREFYDLERLWGKAPPVVRIL